MGTEPGMERQGSWLPGQEALSWQLLSDGTLDVSCKVCSLLGQGSLCPGAGGGAVTSRAGDSPTQCRLSGVILCSLKCHCTTRFHMPRDGALCTSVNNSAAAQTAVAHRRCALNGGCCDHSFAPCYGPVRCVSRGCSENAPGRSLTSRGSFDPWLPAPAVL